MSRRWLAAAAVVRPAKAQKVRQVVVVQDGAAVQVKVGLAAKRDAAASRRCRELAKVASHGVVAALQVKAARPVAQATSRDALVPQVKAALAPVAAYPACPGAVSPAEVDLAFPAADSHGPVKVVKVVPAACREHVCV